MQLEDLELPGGGHAAHAAWGVSMGCTGSQQESQDLYLLKAKHMFSKPRDLSSKTMGVYHGLPPKMEI